MNARERILAAYRFEEIRPVPYTVWYDHETMLKLNRYYGGEGWKQRIQDHILRIMLNWEPKDFIDANHYKDVFGTVWQTGDPVHVVQPVLKEPSLQHLSVRSFVPFARSCGSQDLKGRHCILPTLGWEDTRQQLLAERGDKLTVVGFGYGLFESGWIIRGYEEFFTDLLTEPNFAHGLLDVMLERQLELVDALLELPCDAIIFADDYGDQRGVTMGPPLWREYVKPRLAKLYQRVHDKGKMTFHHSCGSVFDIIGDLIDIGLDVLQSLQPEAMPVYEIKKRFGKNIRLWGGVGTQHLLPFGTPKEIRDEVKRMKKELGAGGGYVLSSSKPIMKEVPVENAAAFLEEVIQTETL